MIPTLKIAQVKNGWIVYPPENEKNMDVEQTNVFQSFAELVLYLEEFFNFRNKFIEVDVE